MAFTRFSARDSTTISNGNLICNNPSILRCPQAIESLVLGQFLLFPRTFTFLTPHTYTQVVLLFGIIIFIWRMGCFNKRLGRKKTTTGESNSKEDHPLSLPYPQPPSERYEATKELEPNNCKWHTAIQYMIFFKLKKKHTHTLRFHSNLHPRRPISRHKELRQLSHLSGRIIQTNANTRTCLEVEKIS